MTETVIEFYLSLQKSNQSYEMPLGSNLSKQPFDYFVDIDINDL